MNKEYKLSGKSGGIWLIGILLGPLLAILVSIIYAYIDVYNPFIYFTLLVYLGYLFSIVLIQKLVIRIAKCRSTKSAYLYGTIVGFIAVYANWSTFLYVFLQRQGEGIALHDILLNPSAVFDFANIISETGWYEIFGFQVSGGLLWFIWIVELVGILVAGIIGGTTVMHEEVFCEDCNRWVEDIKLDLRLSIPEEYKNKPSYTGDIDTLTEFSIAEENESPHIRVNVHHCSKCNNLSTIDIDMIRLEKNDKGGIEEKDDDFSPVIIISKDQYKKITEMKGKQADNIDVILKKTV